MQSDQRLEVQQKLQTAQQLIEDTLGSLRVIPETGAIDVRSVDYSVGRLMRARDELVNARANLNPR